MLLLRNIGLVEHVKPTSKWEHNIKQKNIITTTRPLEMLHIDLFGPIAYISIDGNKYGLVIIDDYSRFTYVIFCKIKVKLKRC
jgi:hypothetical protein